MVSSGGGGSGDGTFSRYECVALVGEQRDGWVDRVTEVPQIIYSLGTQVPRVLG